MVAIEISKNVFSVGAKDPKRRMFDALIPLPEGTTYNSYLVRGSKKTALIDTVNPGFEEELLNNLKSIMPIEKLDYIVMNHAEPDHANAIPFIMEKAKNAKLVVGKVGADTEKGYYGIKDDRLIIVDEKIELSLGDKTLKFIDAPWLHWPETIFTYLVEDEILFPCDFFGQHYSSEKTYDWEVNADKLENTAKRYFGEIMMPFRKPGQNALMKLRNYGIKMIAPSHGVIYKNPEKIILLYEKWTAGKLEKKVLLLYVSMWGSSEKMAVELEKELKTTGVAVNAYDLQHADLGDVARELVDSACVVIGAPTVLGNVHPLAAHAVNVAKLLRPPIKYAAVLSSYGWGAAAARTLTGMLDNTQIEIIGAVEVKARPTVNDLKNVRDLAGKIEERLNSLE